MVENFKFASLKILLCCWKALKVSFSLKHTKTLLKGLFCVDHTDAHRSPLLVYQKNATFQASLFFVSVNFLFVLSALISTGRYIHVYRRLKDRFSPEKDKQISS